MKMSVAWITGGGTGIGHALAEQLCQRGYAIAITGRRQGPLQETVQTILKKIPGARVAAWDGDVSKPDQLKRIHEEILGKWGPVSVLLNNAGYNPHHGFDETSNQEFQQSWETNCLGAVYAARLVLPAMKQQRGGTIINISSILGLWASPRSMAYSVSKYAIAGFTDALRQELLGSGVHVMGVYPGFIKTAMTEPFVKPGSMKSHFGKTPDQMARAILKGMDKRKARVQYPAYSYWLPLLYNIAPRWMESFAKKFSL